MVPLWAFVIGLLATASIALVLAELSSPEDEEAPAASTPLATNSYEVEYRKLAMLRGGMSLVYFEQVLGVPLFVTRSRDGNFTQHLFRGNGYWVQAVSDEAGAVQLMAVTSCNRDFRPEFRPVGIDQVVLNQTRFADLSGPNRIRYFTSGATANSYYFDEYYRGNPSHYQTYFVGINDACAFQLPEGLPPLLQYDQEYDSSDVVVAQLRREAVVNTYAETAVFFDGTLLESFQVGPDRILTRTSPPLEDIPQLVR